MSERVCSDCGRPHSRGGRQCPRCYMADYRATRNGQTRTRAANDRWNAAHREERLAYWRLRHRRAKLDRARELLERARVALDG